MTLPADPLSLRSLLGSLPVSLVAVDSNGIVMVWNDHAEAMFGWPAAEAVGRPLREVVRPSENRESPEAIIETLRRGQRWEGEYRLLDRSGAEFAVHVIDTPLFNADGTPGGFLGMAVDVTRDRQAPIAVLEAVVLHSPISVTVIDADDRIVMTMGDSRTTADVKESYAGRKISDLVPDPAYLAMVNRVRMGERGRQTIAFAGRTYDTTGVPLPDWVAGAGSAAFIATDITERVAESRRFQALVENLEEVTAILNADGSVRYVSPAIETLTGYAPDAVMGRTGLGDVHPDDAAAVVAAFATVVAEPATVVHQTCRLRHRDGSWRDVEQTLANHVGDQFIKGFLAVARDATARAVAERRAQQQAMVSRLGWTAMTGELDHVMEEAVAVLASFALRHVILYEALPDGAGILVRAVAGEEVPVARGDVVSRSDAPIIDAVLATGSSVSVGDVGADSDYRLPWESPFVGTGSAVGVPIQVKGATVAALLVRSFAANVFDRHDVAFYESIANVVSGAAERIRYEADLRHDATHHRLTGLPNRVLLQDRATQALARCRRRQRGHVALMVADVDGLLAVNEQHGRDAGDQVVALVGARLNDAIRPSDTVAHSAGDEFVILCEDLADPGEAAAVAARIIERVREPFVVGGREISVTMSVGIAVGSRDATVDGLLHDADAAMYRAKETGRNRYEIFDEALRIQVGHRKDIEHGLHGAIDRGEFTVAYQPVVDLAGGGVAEAEALLRWTMADGTQVSPTEFIPIAEETGLIVPVGAWVLLRACQDAVRWNQHFAPEQAVSVAVNLSARQIAHPDIVPTVVSTLEHTGLAPHLLRLEITETSLMEEGGEGVATLKALDAIGVQLSVDDFGTGYSSLMYLRRYPVRVLKVDRYFIAGLGKNPGDEAIVEAVISLAHALGLRATAEGVETVEQLERLRTLACDHGQGYLWSRAVPYAEFIPMVDALRAGHAGSVTDPAERLAATAPVAAAPAVTSAATRRVVLVDDSPSDRGLLRIALEDAGNFTVVGEAGSGEAAIAVAAATQPDVLVLDMSMAGMNGLEAVGPIRRASPETRVVFLSGFLSGALAQAAIHAGAYMNFDKSLPFEMVAAQLGAALSGDRERAGLARGSRSPAP